MRHRVTPGAVDVRLLVRSPPMASLARTFVSLVVAAVGFVGSANAQSCCTGNVSTYCTAGTSVQGCVPNATWSGVPSSDTAAGFTLSFGGIPAQRSGTIFYGFYSFVTPWAPGSPSFLCVATPVQRTGNSTSGGTLGQCNGSLSLDFNAWRAANSSALGAPFAPGQTIRAQAWYRDPSAPAQTNLTDAITFNLCAGTGDITPPVITGCPPAKVAPLNSTCVSGTVPSFLSGVVASDNCSTSPVIAQSPSAGTNLPAGTYVVTITVTDAAGNRSQCTTSLTIADTTRPTVSYCAPSASVTANANCEGAIPDFVSTLVATDNCGTGALTISQSPPAGTTVGVGIHAIYLTVVDAAGNIESVGRTLTVASTPSCAGNGMVKLPPGTFVMGSGVHVPHLVTLTTPFWLSPTEVSQSQFQSIMGANPSFFANPGLPVERVSWNDAVTYCALLTAQQSSLGAVPPGYEYRLPTEAEWEYACRSGTTGSHAFFLCNVNNFFCTISANYSYTFGTTQASGTYPGNDWQLYDMHGNVAEWCLDTFSDYSAAPVVDPFVTGGNRRVYRGGGWGSSSAECASAARAQNNPPYFNNSLGFRVVLAPIQTP